MTPAAVEAIAAADQDGTPMNDEDWAKAEIVQPRKVTVGLKLDHHLLD